jgi:hypothetical protein
MKTEIHKTAMRSTTRPASLQRKPTPQTQTLVDRRSSSALQRRLMHDIDNSSAMMLQRRQLELGHTPAIQRVAEEEEELMQGKFNNVQRQILEEEEPLQGKFAQTLQRQPDSTPQSNNTGMPDNLKSGIESLSGIDISDVRVHHNSSKPAQLNALAYAQGNDIHLASGQEHHLPHEAWHTVQQRQGRVQPTMQMEGQQINDDAGLEREADVMGARALQYKK